VMVLARPPPLPFPLKVRDEDEDGGEGCDEAGGPNTACVPVALV